MQHMRTRMVSSLQRVRGSGAAVGTPTHSSFLWRNEVNRSPFVTCVVRETGQKLSVSILTYWKIIIISPLFNRQVSWKAGSYFFVRSAYSRREEQGDKKAIPQAQRSKIKHLNYPMGKRLQVQPDFHKWKKETVALNLYDPCHYINKRCGAFWW